MNSTSIETNVVRREQIESASEIFDKHGHSIRAMIRSQVNSECQVDDIFQDLFLSLARNPIPPYVRNVRGYLHRAVRNDVVDVARRAKADRVRLEKFTEELCRSLNPKTPQDALIQDEQIGKIFRLVQNKLCPREAQAIIYRFRYNENTREAAEKMGVNRRTLSRYLCVGMRKIRRFIRDNEQEQLEVC